jgi:radical SAM superfamily enzyme YgiQ (UPF0313 family)
MDLGIEVILKIFSKSGLQKIFNGAFDKTQISSNAKRIYQLRDAYIQTIDPVITFLQHKNPTLAQGIAGRNYLPEASRFETLEDLDWAFGSMGTLDHARHLATLYLEDIGDFIKEVVDPHFGFSRYAERMARTATDFSILETHLKENNSIISETMEEILSEKISEFHPDVVCISVPFPGNVFAALKCGQFIKSKFPKIKIVLGGGYVNTELRSLNDERLFEYIDFVSFDDGEAPLELLLEYLQGIRKIDDLKRITTLRSGVVMHLNGAKEKDVPQREVGTPDYDGFRLKDYLSVIEVVNPMHRLWSDGRWNKLTLAHGCYWGKCTFCDITLDYIKRYEPVDASLLCDRIETLILQTGETGFHFVDEAAPPALMRDLAIEILKRKLTITWWTNIRFEKSFTPDICRLLKASGCIAVSGGLEVASDRLLDLMKKGVTVAQVAQVADAFTQAGIMVHAYLMYGFPTQTDQETIDSLENVRQLFESGVIQSGFWHQFAMTAHSPVGMAPEEYRVQHTGPVFQGFAENDYFHEDPEGANHELYSEGLKTSLFNFMHGVGFDFPLKDWFDFKTPKTIVKKNFISNAIAENLRRNFKNSDRMLWMGGIPDTENFGKETLISVHNNRNVISFLTSSTKAKFIIDLLEKSSINSTSVFSISEANSLLQHEKIKDWASINDFLISEEGLELLDLGLLIL